MSYFYYAHGCIDIERSGVIDIDRFSELWNAVYPGETVFKDRASDLIHSCTLKEVSFKENWFSRAVIYSLYVDFFNRTIAGLTEKLSYLEDLGVTCLWLLPVLDSPMKDGGFDIRNYRHIRADMSASGEPDEEFDRLLSEAHKRNIRIIFDIALNHCSNEHPWFVEARTSRRSRYRDFFIWSDSPDTYADARIIFKGLCTSNWEFDEATEQYYFHRFFPIQPDLNYRNPRVTYEMIAVLLSWLTRGIDGFRADAIPYLWKEEGTSCENLPTTHRILKIFRYALDAVKPGTLFLAEANQPPYEVVEYLRTGDECNAAYHFPLMPQIFKSLAIREASPVPEVLSPDVTPPIPHSASWVTFLRCHDELSLEMVNREDRKIIFNYYARRSEWNFREGEGISGRLFTLLNGDVERILLAWAIIFTLPGTPVLYYGDEVALANDVAYWKRQIKQTGYNDSRYLNRGPFDWKRVADQLEDPTTPASVIRRGLQQLIRLKKKEAALSRGSLEFLESGDPALLAYDRTLESEKIMIRCNLGVSGRFYTGNGLLPATGRLLYSNVDAEDYDRGYLGPDSVVIVSEGGKES